MTSLWYYLYKYERSTRKRTIISLSVGERQTCANSVDPDQTLHNVTSDQVYIVYQTSSIALDKSTDNKRALFKF